MLAYLASHLPAGILAGLTFLWFVYRLLRPALIASTLPGITLRESRRIVRSAALLVLQLVAVGVLVLLAYAWLSRTSPRSNTTPQAEATMYVSLPAPLLQSVPTHSQTSNHRPERYDSS
jgi:hypothetical protein